ncbi:hypothetical protein, partial [Bergeriella denitrificans]|uniref:hypothetical protein n=1 Tax=Bergeriella denitrificans TaxID=494 RepID=UPI001C3F8799
KQQVRRPVRFVLPAAACRPVSEFNCSDYTMREIAYFYQTLKVDLPQNVVLPRRYTEKQITVS